jgi:hypothetical protein
MAINFTISATGTNIVNQADIDASLSKNLNIENFSDDQNNLASIDDYTFEWYFIDKPQASSCSFDTTITSNDKTIRLDAIDTWGSYRIFCIAKETANVVNKSNDNPLRAEETSFINIIVKSSNNLLEKPASFQRGWKSQYDKLVDVVDNTTKRVNNLKVSNSTTFTLPTSDGTNGQFITTNGSGLLSFSSLDLSNMETNLSLNSLSDVNVVNPTDGYALVWNTDRWEPGEVSGGNSNLAGLASDGSSTLTITDGYNLVPNTDNFVNSGVNIGTLAAPFTEVNSQFVYCDTLFAGGVEYPATDGQPNTYLKTNGINGTSFSAIAYAEISGVPDISSFIELTDLSVAQNSASGNGTLSYNNTSGILTYTPPDLSNLGGGGGGSGLTNWTENASGHIIPNTNATYDIGNAENKVRHLFLSDNSLFIGDTSISLSTNSNISSDNSNKSFELGASSIDMDSYKFSFSDTSPTSISGGITYRIKSIGSTDFTLVGAKFNQVGHIFTASIDGTSAGLADDGVSFVSQSENYDKVSLFVERDMMNSQNIKLRYNASGESKEVITISGSPLDIPDDPGILIYNSGSWTASTLSSLSIKKTVTEKHSGEWSTIIDYPDDPNNPGSKLNTFTTSGGSSKFLFAIKNNSGNSMIIKKITLTCSEMYSSTIDWTAATATDAEFTTNVATKLSLMSNQRIEQTNESGGVGMGTVTFEDSNYNSLNNNYWLVIAINAISAGASADKNFTVSFSYT